MLQRKKDYCHKQQLMSVSARALKVCMSKPDPMISFKKIHEINKRAKPTEIMLYKHSLLLHKLYNEMQPNVECLNLHFQHQFSARQNRFSVSKTNKIKVRENILVNWLAVINHQIPLDWLNLTHTTYKIKCKEKYLK